MLWIIFDKEERCIFSDYKETPLHKASQTHHHEAIKYLIERGANVNSIWIDWLLEYRMNAITLINNFNDPFYQQFKHENKITTSQMNILIENGMI